MSKAFDDWYKDHAYYEYGTITMMDAFNAGRESLCSQRESYLRGYRAGRAYQREEDARIAKTIDSVPFVELRETIAQTIREQKIDD